VKRGPKSWQARWRDENGQQRGRGGFVTKSEARAWVDGKAREVAALRRGDVLPVSGRPQSMNALFDLFLEKHGATVDPATEAKLQRELKQARAVFGDRHPDSLQRLELEDWRATLSPGSRHHVFRALRQSLTWAHQRGLVERDASAGIRNPKRKRHERKPIVPFETWEELETVAAELDPRHRAIPIFAAGTGLRPEEWIALERGDIDRDARLVHVRRRFSRGVLKDGGKTDGSVRTVPLRQRVLDALDAMPARIDTRLLFPAHRGGYIDLDSFRTREWTPALRSAGVEVRSIYTMRHTFATWAIESGLQLSYIATIMGTSVRELEDTYFRWLQRTDDRLLAAFDAYDQKEAVSG
jgi:integrase